MASCCEDKSCEIDALKARHRDVLWAVLVINAAIFLIEGVFMLLFGLGVLAEAGWKVIHPVLPDAPTMGAVGALALAANLVCFYLLYRHRDDNLNLRSTWLCSCNDLFANTGVLLAAGAGYALASRWPDILVGAAIAGLFLHSAWDVLRDAVRALRRPAKKRIEIAIREIK